MKEQAEEGLPLKDCEVRILIQVEESCHPDKLKMFKETFVQHLKDYEDRYGMKFNFVLVAGVLLSCCTQISESAAL